MARLGIPGFDDFRQQVLAHVQVRHEVEVDNHVAKPLNPSGVAPRKRSKTSLTLAKS